MLTLLSSISILLKCIYTKLQCRYYADLNILCKNNCAQSVYTSTGIVCVYIIQTSTCKFQGSIATLYTLPAELCTQEINQACTMLGLESSVHLVLSSVLL